jgi:hypothetical protein
MPPDDARLIRFHAPGSGEISLAVSIFGGSMKKARSSEIRIVDEK